MGWPVIKRSNSETLEERLSTLVLKVWADRMLAGCLEWEDEQYHWGPPQARGCRREENARLTEIKYKETDAVFTRGCENKKKHSLHLGPNEKLETDQKRFLVWLFPLL